MMLFNIFTFCRAVVFKWLLGQQHPDHLDELDAGKAILCPISDRLSQNLEGQARRLPFSRPSMEFDAG